jgi:hypothetical protein
LAPTPASTARQLSELERNVWCLAMGFTCANAFSVKMTGAVTPFLVAVESFFGLWFLKRGAPFLDLLKVLTCGMLTYAGWFAVHFAILTRHGDGDEEFTTEQFQSTLLESRHYDPAARWEGFWTTFYSLNRRMIVHNANILAPHPWMSSWSEWVLNSRGVAYYGKDGKDTYTAAVYLIGNHAIHMGVIAGLALFVACVALHLRVRPFAARLHLVLGHAATAASPALNAFFASGSFCVVACVTLPALALPAATWPRNARRTPRRASGARLPCSPACSTPPLCAPAATASTCCRTSGWRAAPSSTTPCPRSSTASCCWRASWSTGPARARRRPRGSCCSWWASSGCTTRPGSTASR